MAYTHKETMIYMIDDMRRCDRLYNEAATDKERAFLKKQYDITLAKLTDIEEHIESKRWRNVKEDGYPNDGKEVFYYFKKTGVNKGRYSKEDNMFYGKQGFLIDDVTHWIPLFTPDEVLK